MHSWKEPCLKCGWLSFYTLQSSLFSKEFSVCSAREAENNLVLLWLSKWKGETVFPKLVLFLIFIYSGRLFPFLGGCFMIFPFFIVFKFISTSNEHSTSGHASGACIIKTVTEWYSNITTALQGIEFLVIILLQVLWASQICCLVFVINFGKFSVIITSNSLHYRDSPVINSLFFSCCLQNPLFLTSATCFMS